MSDQLKHMEEMLATLIKMQASNNARIEELTEEMKEVRAEMKEVRAEMKETKDGLKSLQADMLETKETLHVFRSETTMRLSKIERHMKLIEDDLDRSMVAAGLYKPPQS